MIRYLTNPLSSAHPKKISVYTIVVTNITNNTNDPGPQVQANQHVDVLPEYIS